MNYLQTRDNETETTIRRANLFDFVVRQAHRISAFISSPFDCANVDQHELPQDELPRAVRAVLRDAERNDQIVTRHDLIKFLRRLELDDFGLIMIRMPDEQYPKVSSLLPSMASEKLQIQWTGSHGSTLLKQTNNFVRFLSTSYTRMTGKSLEDAQILDFGCGYGRVIRSMYFYADPDHIAGVDPWETAINECFDRGITDGIFLSDELPEDLPVNKQFQLIYAFSVFTHLSQRAATQALETVRKYIAEDGVLVITTRPIEYWAFDSNIPADKKIQLEDLHRTVGFAFYPSDREPVDGDITYGETSMTVRWFQENFPKWRVALVDQTSIDPLQVFLALYPA